MCVTEAGIVWGEKMRRGEGEAQSVAGLWRAPRVLPTLVVEMVVIMGMLKGHCCPSMAVSTAVL